ncbi:MAG: (Fe-S)-binding protein [Opitutaceae bacterium]|nr:(Fe-S)-binding protein [Opitutaceae bacterium]
MHCGMCLPTCPTYDETKLEKHSPRGRIALMRAIADGELEVTKAFGEEMYYCLGCLACTTACPANVDYPNLFETARAEIERQGVLDTPKRTVIRTVVLRGLFTRPRLLRFVGRLLYAWQASGFEALVRRSGLLNLLPPSLRRLEPQSPRILPRFSHQLIAPVEKPLEQRSTLNSQRLTSNDQPGGPAAETPFSVQRSELNVKRSPIPIPPAPIPSPFRRVAVLTGCVQDLAFADINRATVDVLLANGCEVHTPAVQPCCGSLHAHNGDVESARLLARRQLDLFNPDDFDAIISNAGGCGSHLRAYAHLLHDDPAYAPRAAVWSKKLKDIHEYLVEINFRKPSAPAHPAPKPNVRNTNIAPQLVTYHESCHLCHGQKVSAQPRAILRALPGVELRECAESQWCCGSAGIYNITQPDTAARLQERKVGHVLATGANIVATANPGCHLQLENGLRAACAERSAAQSPSHLDTRPSTPLPPSTPPTVTHPIVLLAAAYAAEGQPSQPIP